MVKVPIFNLSLWIRIIYASYGLTLMFSLGLQVCWASSASLNRQSARNMKLDYSSFAICVNLGRKVYFCMVFHLLV